MSRPRVVHVTTTDISLELLLGPQLSAFVDAGYEVIGASAPGEFVPAVEERGVRHVPLRNATRAMAPTRDVRALGELHRLFRELRPDIVHTHNPKPGLYGRIAARSARVPAVVNTVHGLYALPEDRFAKRAVVYSLERLASTCSDAELVQNPEDLELLRTTLRMPERKLHLLGNGVDLRRFRPPPDAAERTRVRRSIGVDDDSVVVGAVGRLVAEKGYPELFTAWHELGDRRDGATLVVVGPDDPDKPDALDRSTVERAKAEGVQFLGMRHDVEELYWAMDVYVLASHREGYPRSAMEAAATGLPVVATRIRGCRQVVDHDRTGLLVTVRDPAALREALRDLIGDPDRRAAMRVAARERAEAEFDQERVISTTLGVYSRLLAQAGRPTPRPEDV